MRRIRTLALPLALPLALLAAHGDARAADPPVTEYRIAVRLKQEDRPSKRSDPRWLLLGEETATFRNPGPGAAHDVKLHLYPRAFEGTGSVFFRELALEDDTGELDRIRRDDRFGYVRVTSIRHPESGVDLAGATRFDDTVMSVTLPTPVAAGGQATLQLSFEVMLPRWIRRMGTWGDHVDAMQWFPKFCARRGDRWIDHPYHLHTEFAADFGTYDVEITVPGTDPKRRLVEATGVPTGDPRPNADGTLTYGFHAERVHDFAWCWNPRFLRFTRKVSSPGSPGDAVEVVLMAQPDHGPMRDRILDATAFGIQAFGKLLPYPYPRVVIDDEPLGRSGGMEYPMLFTISMRRNEPAWCTAPEGVTLHEFGHQYFHGLVATNEFEEAWLDEGINTWFTDRLIERHFGPVPEGRTLHGLGLWAAAAALNHGPGVKLGGLELGLGPLIGFEESPLGGDRGNLLGFEMSFFSLRLPGLERARSFRHKARYLPFATGSEPLPTVSWGFPKGGYRAAVYSKASLVLETLERHAGAAAMDELVGEWVRENAFRHPTTKDFTDLLRRRLTRDAAGNEFPIGAFVEQLIHGTGAVEFALEGVRTIALTSPVGLEVEGIGGTVTRRDEPAPQLLDGRPAWVTTVAVRRLGEARLPVELLVRFDDGSEQRETWDGGAASKVFEFRARAAASWVVLDPDRKHALERNRNDNAWSRRRSRSAVGLIAGTVLFWIQQVLHAAASIA